MCNSNVEINQQNDLGDNSYFLNILANSLIFI